MFWRIFLLPIILFAFSAGVLSQTEMKKLNIGLNAPGDILITKADGKRLGYDAVGKKNYEEIEDSTISTARNREPVYRFPVGSSEKSLTIKIFGKKATAKGDLGISFDDFTIRIIGLALEPKTNFTVTFEMVENKIEFSSNTVSLEPNFSYAFDSADANQPSYIFKLKRTKLSAKKKISLSLNTTAAIFTFTDNDILRAKYALEVTRINPDGIETIFSDSAVKSVILKLFRIDFNDKNGKPSICLRESENAKNFNEENCRQLQPKNFPQATSFDD